MELHELMGRIRLPEKAQETAEKFDLDEGKFQKQAALFYEDTGKFLEEWKKSDHHRQRGLAFCLQLACKVYEEYQKAGIAEEIFDATFYDITIWCEECRRTHQSYGLEEIRWIALSLKMRLFRLGRLQFEPMTLCEELVGQTLGLKAGTPVLNVHIPAGEKLDYGACVEAMKWAEEFFGDTFEAYVCDSWLLSPVLGELLPETSNIMRFQRMFEVVKVHHRFPQAEQRIFKEVLAEKEKYQEDTLLQKKAKEYILSGKDIGIGIGIKGRQYDGHGNM